MSHIGMSVYSGSSLSSTFSIDIGSPDLQGRSGGSGPSDRQSAVVRSASGRVPAEWKRGEAGVTVIAVNDRDGSGRPQSGAGSADKRNAASHDQAGSRGFDLIRHYRRHASASNAEIYDSELARRGRILAYFQIIPLASRDLAVARAAAATSHLIDDIMSGCEKKTLRWRLRQIREIGDDIPMHQVDDSIATARCARHLRADGTFQQLLLNSRITAEDANWPSHAWHSILTDYDSAISELDSALSPFHRNSTASLKRIWERNASATEASDDAAPLPAAGSSPNIPIPFSLEREEASAAASVRLLRRDREAIATFLTRELGNGQNDGEELLAAFTREAISAAESLLTDSGK